MAYTATLRGLTIGQGTSYPWTKMPAGHGTAVRQLLVDNPAGGAIPVGPDRAEVGQLVFEMRLTGPSQLDIQTLRDALVAAWDSSDVDGVDELTMVLVSGERVFRGRPKVVDVNLDQIVRGGIGAARCVFTVLDPVWYGSTASAFFAMPSGADGVVVASGGVTVASGGVTVAGGAISDTSAWNTGSAPANWTARIVGPVDHPRLSVDGKTVTINYNLPANATAVIDSRTRSVEVDGSPRPYIAPSSQWALLPANRPVQVSLRGDSGAGIGTLTWRHATR